MYSWKYWLTQYTYLLHVNKRKKAVMKGNVLKPDQFKEMLCFYDSQDLQPKETVPIIYLDELWADAGSITCLSDSSFAVFD